MGAHVVRALRGAGLGAVVLDDLSAGEPARLPDDVTLIRGDVRDPVVVRRVFGRYRPAGIVHLAAPGGVADAAANPLRSYRDRVDGLRGLLQGAAAYGIGRFLYASSAAVYGVPRRIPVTEDDPTQPVHAYGRSVLAGEWLLRDAAAATGIAWAALRYFNVAGAAAPDLRDRTGTTLLPRLVRAAADGTPARVFGADFGADAATPDGTAVRDYVHVADAADACARAAVALGYGELDAEVLNVGRGVGVSVRDLVDAVSRVLGRPLPYLVEPRRPGDPAAVVAATDRIAGLLGWQARYDLDDIVGSVLDRVATPV